MALIETRNIWKTYEMGAAIVHALQDVSIKIEKGDYVAIMGPSGSGKSTLMNLIGCLDTPTQGEYYFNGKLVSQLDDDELAVIRNRQIGFVFQTFNLVPTLSAQKNVELPMIFLGVPKRKRAARAKELLTKVGLADRIRHKPNELSGGERQRVAIARALANNPEIILADEPTGNLDTETGGTILELLRRLSVDDGRTVVLVTHDPEAVRIAGRVIRLRDGRTVEETANA